MRFGPFELDVQSRELLRGTARVRLQDQPFEILRLMLERPGEVVTREALRHRLWPQGTYVDFEHSLNAAVKRLRAALGDDADNPRFVETLPRRGYRFIAPLHSAAAPMLRKPAAASITSGRPRLAVLPFANLSDDSDDEIFSDGLTEELIAQLGPLFRGRIGVLARWSCSVFKGTRLGAREIGEALRADYLLEGGVRREGDRLRITVRLVEASNETLLWSEAHERELSDCVGAPHGKLSIQTDVAAHVARALALELVPAAPAVVRSLDAAAYQSYLKGRYYWSKTDGDDGLERAIECYEQAVRQAPSFGAAYAALARAHVARAEMYRECPRQALEAAQTLAARALSLDPSLCEAHLARAEAARMLGWQWDAAEDAYAQARALNPSFVGAYRCYAVMLAAMARHDDAMRESDRAFELDPLCLEAGTAAAWVRYLSGDVGASIDYCRNALDMDPEWVPARRVLGAAYLEAGRAGEAIAELERAVSMADGDPVPLLWLAHAEAAAGSRDEAARLVERAQTLARSRYVPWFHLALAYVGLDDGEAALNALDRAAADCDPFVANVAVEPRLQSLRREERFKALVARIGLA